MIALAVDTIFQNTMIRRVSLTRRLSEFGSYLMFPWRAGDLFFVFHELAHITVYLRGWFGVSFQGILRTRLQPLFAADLADWLDEDARLHPCNIEISYHGYEILEGLCISALDHRRVDLPLDTSQCVDIFARMRRELPDCPERG